MSNYNEVPNIDHETTVAIITVMMFVSGVFYIILAMYFDQVIADQYGFSKPFMFPLKVSSGCNNM